MTSRLEALPELTATYRACDDDIAAFQRDGHVKLRGVLSREELSAYRPYLAQLVTSRSPDEHAMEQKVAGSGKNWMFINNLWTLDPGAHKFVLGERFGRIAAELMRVDAVRLFRDQSYFKAPGSANTPWHQDAYFMPLDTDQIITFWIPMTDISPDMAPMSYVTGSHRAGYLGTSTGEDRAMDAFEDGLRRRGFSIFNYQRFTAGEIAVHAGMTLHSSRSNTSSRLREALVLVLFADGATVSRERTLGLDAPPQEHYARMIRRENHATSLPGLDPGALAAGPMTPIVYWSSRADTAAPRDGRP